jgi:predicted dehydrogenase
MRLDYITQELWIEAARENRQPKYPWQEPLKLELQHFADCVMNKEKPIVTGEDGFKALRIAEAALLSSEKNKAIKLR